MSLRKWTSEKWVDIANPKKGGGFPPCGRSKGEKRKCHMAAETRNKVD